MSAAEPTGLFHNEQRQGDAKLSAYEVSKIVGDGGESSGGGGYGEAEAEIPSCNLTAKNKDVRAKATG